MLLGGSLWITLAVMEKLDGVLQDSLLVVFLHVHVLGGHDTLHLALCQDRKDDGEKALLLASVDLPCSSFRDDTAWHTGYKVS